MTEHDIRGHVMAIAGAISTKNEAALALPALALATQVLVDLNRIAGALELLALKDVR